MPQHAQSDDLMLSLLGKLNQITLGGEEGQPSPNYFTTWCAPGIPYPETDFEFMQTTGSNDADRLRKLNQQSYIWSRFVDFIPDISGVYNPEKQNAIYQSDGTRLSNLWDVTLRMSEVAATPLTDEQKAALKRIDEILAPTRTEIDPITGEEVKRSVTSALEMNYERFRMAYETAVLELNAKRIAATVGTDAQAVADWQFNAPVYRSRARMAMNAWVTQGRKLEYERLVQFKEDTLNRNLSLVRQDLRERYENANITSVMDNQEFPMTGVVPPNFAEAAGWTKFTFEERESHFFQRETHSSFAARGGLNLGFFRIGASMNYSRDDKHIKMSGENFKMEFELCQAPILRSWFSPWFLRMRAWRFPDNIPAGLLGENIPGVDSKTLSTGERPPRGHMFAYPTSAIFARNVKINFAEFEHEENETRTSMQTGASVGWGPFSLGGTYKRDTYERKVDFEFDGQGLSVPGMQVIGFKNYILPRSPFPHPDIEEWESTQNPVDDLVPTP